MSADLTDILTWSAFAILLIAVGYTGYRLLRSRLDAQRYREEMADMAFQESVLGSLSGIAAEDDSRFLQTPDAESLPQSVSTTSVADAGSVSAAPVNPPVVPAAAIADSKDSLRADIAAAGVMSQLRAANLVSTVEGYLELHGNPQGVAILKLRNGKTALLVPGMESEAFLRRNARRAEYIIMAGADGKAVVIQPMEQFLADSLQS